MHKFGNERSSYQFYKNYGIENSIPKPVPLGKSHRNPPKRLIIEKK